MAVRPESKRTIPRGKPVSKEESRKATIAMLERCGKHQTGDHIFPDMGRPPVEPEYVNTEFVAQTDHGIEGARRLDYPDYDGA